MKKIKIDHINLLHLKGTKEEMAYQHGKLLQEEIRNSAINVLAKKNQMVIKSGSAIRSLESLFWLSKRERLIVTQTVYQLRLKL